MISFIHRGGPNMASYRYRAEIPARTLVAKLNAYPADIMIFAKPMPGDPELARLCKLQKSKIVADFCDDHFDEPIYQQMLDIADVVTCSTPKLAERLDCDSHIVPDCFEFQEEAPHCNGRNLLWFGHAVNYQSIAKLNIEGVRIVCNKEGCIPWSLLTMREEFARADIVLLPRTADYKSPNRAIEAIRQGCFVVAEPHPALRDFPIWIGDIQEGIEWAASNPDQANAMTKQAQAFVSEWYSPAMQAAAWRKALAEFL